MRIYRIEVSAYNSAHPFPSAWFIYDIRALDRNHAIEQLPKRHQGPKNVLYQSPDNFGRRFALPYFGERRLPAWYGEWQVMNVEHVRNPGVWLGKTSVQLVETGIFARDDED